MEELEAIHATFGTLPLKSPRTRETCPPRSTRQSVEPARLEVGWEHAVQLGEARFISFDPFCYVPADWQFSQMQVSLAESTHN